MPLVYYLYDTGTTDKTKRLAYKQRIAEYMDRAEKLKTHVENEKEGRMIPN